MVSMVLNGILEVFYSAIADKKLPIGACVVQSAATDSNRKKRSYFFKTLFVVFLSAIHYN